MARPAKFDRQEALQTAMNAIWKNGFEQSSVKALSDLLGITRSSFYNSFSSREALFREVMPDYAAQSPDAPLYATARTPVLPIICAVYRDLCRVRAADPEGRGCMMLNTICELCPETEGLGSELADKVLGSIDRLEELLEIARSGGEITDTANPRALALALQNLMVGLNVLCKVVRDEEELWLLARTTLEGLGLYREGKAA
ncbi:TetR/AcrR family transcriptional regulator [Kordiimonas aestuarii]|uniref:TetR/AcrR family transcriptional regulator n=1 Tax=Kordiimonas aestuarii TaxID=1005925 RepID=UPI0021D3A30D|nr:TetR/AcrR family transcriptional regulator [Kordiimonas aestuarii]